MLIPGLASALLTISIVAVSASPFTPLAWQQRVEKHFNVSFIGQRKHTTWVRDRNRNFIDDVIEKRREKLKEIDIVVDLNSYLAPKEIEEKFEDYGEVVYIGKLITFFFLNHVNAERLPAIAQMDEVAMIEIQEFAQPALDISARAIQAKKSNEYSPNTAQDDGFSGSGINIAVIDTGVDDTEHQQLLGKFVAGFDATKFEDLDHDGIDDSGQEPGDGTTNPDDDWCVLNKGHGTMVAGIALGKGVANADCRNPAGETGRCAGVAPEAGLVDIKVCRNTGSGPLCLATCEKVDMAEALDWLGLHHEQFKIRVANLSLTYGSDDDGLDDDGTSAIPQQVNYLSALGIVMVAAHGNSSGTPYIAGTRLTQSPGSASFAVTVSGTHDQTSISRSDDTVWTNGYLVGPRSDFDPLSPELLALKPDISAPAVNIKSSRYNSADQYGQGSGTSLSAPHVSGAAAVLLQVRPEMNPGDVKDTLKRSADSSNNTAYNPVIDPKWDQALGSGMLNVWGAIHEPASTDVGFPTCSGPPANPGRPCALAGGLPHWNNNVDIDTTSPPQAGVETIITAKVRNFGPVDAIVRLNFGVYVFAAGNNQFFHIGSQQVAIPFNSTATVSHPWTPASSDHQCVQISIDYGPDTNFENNVTQRNLAVSPSLYKIRVENPFTVPAVFQIRATSLRDGWDCRVQDEGFKLHPYLDPPRMVQINFDPPQDAKPGERADCDVAVYARPQGKKKEKLIGGVTVQTFVPEPCRMIGWIRDQHGRAIPGAEVRIGQKPQQKKAVSDREGFISFEGIPYRPQLISVVTRKITGEEIKARTEARLYCGAGTFEMVVADNELTIETHRRNKDWAWDLQLREGYKAKRMLKK